jgi:hypothetical protein
MHAANLQLLQPAHSTDMLYVEQCVGMACTVNVMSWLLCGSGCVEAKVGLRPSRPATSGTPCHVHHLDGQRSRGWSWAGMFMPSEPHSMRTLPDFDNTFDTVRMTVLGSACHTGGLVWTPYSAMANSTRYSPRLPPALGDSSGICHMCGGPRRHTVRQLKL